MLVLSRKKNQRIVFSNLGITISVVSIDGSRVGLGFDAPDDVQILREELASTSDFLPTKRPIDRHAIRNRLNTIMLSLHVLSQVSVLDPEEGDAALAKAIWELGELDRELDGKTNVPSAISKPQVEYEVTKSDRPRRALVVEDNDNERGLLAAYLRMRGYEVVEADDGVAAIRYLESNELPDVVLLDMNLPKLNGAKTISRIRHTPGLRDVKIFGVSGTDRLDWRIPIGGRGVDGWFRKPINPESLIHDIEEAACI